nr:hypothetical protein [Nostoc sp. ChiQUE02]MDZ8231273.1 hypothetical protein [Nostoc sp. ChiQUE02]
MSHSNWRNLLLVYLVLIVSGAGLFTLGYNVALLNETNLPKRQEIIINALLALVPTGMGFVGWLVFREFDFLIKEQVNQTTIQAIKSIQDTEKMIADIGLSEEKYQECLKILQKANERIELYGKHSQVAQKISKWLSSSKNRSRLTEEVVKIAQKNHIIPPEVLPFFKRDIARSINWLRDSIIRLNGYDVDSTYIEEIQKVPDGFATYRAALYAIELHPQLAELTGDTKVIGNFVRELVAKLEELVK